MELDNLPKEITATIEHENKTYSITLTDSDLLKVNKDSVRIGKYSLVNKAITLLLTENEKLNSFFKKYTMQNLMDDIYYSLGVFAFWFIILSFIGYIFGWVKISLFMY